MKTCLSQALTMSASFAEDVAAYADAGCTAVEVWLTKLEEHLKTSTPEATLRLLASRGLTLAAGAFQGGLLQSQGEERRLHLEHFQRRLCLCQELGIPVLIVAADLSIAPDQEGLARIQAALQQAAQLAASQGVRLALEFQARSRFCNNLETALALIEACAEPNLGICLDLFHYWTGPSKPEDLTLLRTEHLTHVQLCDLAGTPRELAGDADRVLPGDGDCAVGPILECLRRLSYQGYISVEAFHPEFWKMKPAAVAEAALAALSRLLS